MIPDSIVLYRRCIFIVPTGTGISPFSSSKYILPHYRHLPYSQYQQKHYAGAAELEPDTQGGNSYTKCPGSNWAARAGTVRPYGPYTIGLSFLFLSPFQAKRLLFIDGLKVGGVAGMGPTVAGQARWAYWLYRKVEKHQR